MVPMSIISRSSEVSRSVSHIATSCCYLCAFVAALLLVGDFFCIIMRQLPFPNPLT